MPRAAVTSLVALLLVSLAGPSAGAAPPADLAAAVAAFERQTGAALVFEREGLPAGRWYDRMPALSTARKLAAAKIFTAEAAKYPRGYLGAMGLDTVGVFAACVSERGDGFRPYDEDVDGYLYYGLWNGDDALAAAYYTDRQLPLTFHHEVFHHVDGTRAGVTSHARHFASDDARFAAAVSGEAPYPAAAIRDADLERLRARAEGYVLRDAVGDYAAKNPGEDQAETARWFMTTLADGLLQAARQPELPGSQRILHLLTQYAGAVPDGPGLAWFVDVALERAHAPDDLARLEQLAARPLDDAGAAEARAVVGRYADGAPLPAAARDRARLWAAAAAITPALIRQRTRPRDGDSAFTVWVDDSYREGAGNSVLRADVRRFGEDGARLGALARRLGADAREQTAAQLATLRLLARYYAYIDRNWSVSKGTHAAFDGARRRIADGLPASAQQLSRAIVDARFAALAEAISPEGEALPALDGAPSRDNPYLAKVDEAIDDPAVRAAIRRVQPAAVKIGGGSGVNLHPGGLVLTNAHVADALGKRFDVLFPSGETFRGETVAISAHLDLALVDLSGARGLPTAPIAKRAPSVGDFVAAIGQPGRYTPSGEPTGYQRFHVSTGEIRGFRPDILGDQSLGRTKHDAWTYWGHSGSPLFNADGAIVALHNSWDSTTAMRHAVPHQAIVKFLGDSGANYEVR